MFKKSSGFKLSGIFCALVFALNCFAWPWDTGARLRKKFYGREDTQVKYQDPLLPFIHADVGSGIKNHPFASQDSAHLGQIVPLSRCKGIT